MLHERFLSQARSSLTKTMQGTENAGKQCWLMETPCFALLRTVHFLYGGNESRMHRLDGATNMWMDGGTWVGTMTDIIWDEDGEMFRLNPRTAVWTPPDPLRRSHRCACPAPAHCVVLAVPHAAAAPRRLSLPMSSIS
jgi:hypothetical protein